MPVSLEDLLSEEQSEANRLILHENLRFDAKKIIERYNNLISQYEGADGEDKEKWIREVFNQDSPEARQKASDLVWWMNHYWTERGKLHAQKVPQDKCGDTHFEVLGKIMRADGVDTNRVMPSRLKLTGGGRKKYKKRRKSSKRRRKSKGKYTKRRKSSRRRRR